MSTPRELLRAVLMGEPSERIPTLPQICTDLPIHIYQRDYEGDWIDSLKRSIEDPDWAYEQVFRLVVDINCDGLRIFVPKTHKVKRIGDELIVLDQTSGNPKGRIDILGGGVFIPDDPEPPIESLSDAKIRLDEMVSEFSSEKIEWLQRMRAKVPERFVASKPGCVSINTYIELRGGPERALMDLNERPEFVNSVMEMQAETMIQRAEKLLPTGIDALYIEDAYASLIGPKHFEKFCMPAFKTFCSHFKESGIPIYLHICGNVNHILEMIAETGVHAFDSLDPLAGVSVADTKRRIGDKITLMGGVDTNTLRWGAPQEVSAEAIQKCREGGPYGYILSAGCSIPPETRLENLRAMVEVSTKSLWKTANYEGNEILM